MKSIDKLYTEWAWRSKSGIPNISNPEDKTILDSILSELNLEEEPILYEGSDSYDTQIFAQLKEKGVIEDNDPIPPSLGDYKWLGKNGGNFTESITNSQDLKIWKLLWTLKPLTAKGESDNLGVGKGEISLYWLYNYNKKNAVKVAEGRAGDDPDLRFEGVGVEVKAMPSGTASINLGKFSQDKSNLQLLSLAFGLNTLTNVLDPQTEAKVLNPGGFNGKDLPAVFESVFKFSNLQNLEDLASKYSVFETIKSNTNHLIEKLGGATDSTEAAKALATLILIKKLGRKPGDGNYLTNVTPTGTMHWWNIDMNKIRQSENLLSSFGVNQSQIKLNFSKVLS
jgi:hypothetical protein|tara:strand:+ start:410 stop:1426 length:1017 start_codon:yes stop_codon:yes gene_type:complete